MELQGQVVQRLIKLFHDKGEFGLSFVTLQGGCLCKWFGFLF